MGHEGRFRGLCGRRIRRNPELNVEPPNGPHGGRKSGRLRAGLSLNSIVRSRKTGAAVGTIDPEAARLCRALTRPRILSSDLIGDEERAQQSTLVRLIFDNVLQLESARGSFVHGIEAYLELRPRHASALREDSTHPLLTRSLQAVHQAALLSHLEPSELGRRLYGFNSHPRTEAWRALLPTGSATAKWIGLSSKSPSVRRLGAYYSILRPASPADPWLRWQLRRIDRRAALCYKLYVSPAPGDLPSAFEQVAELCTEMRIPAMKVGRTLQAVLRPDKLVLYSSARTDVQAIARELQTVLTSVSPQGAPFTSPIDPTGLISWGVDPGPNSPLGPRRETSWRQFVSGTLARALSVPGRGNPSTRAEFALERARVEGIATDDWSPCEVGW